MTISTTKKKTKAAVDDKAANGDARHDVMREDTPTYAQLHVASTVFKLCGDVTRMRIIMLLAEREELCVGEMTTILENKQSNISQALSGLRFIGAVEARRENMKAMYSLTSKGAIIACAANDVYKAWKDK